MCVCGRNQKMRDGAVVRALASHQCGSSFSGRPLVAPLKRRLFIQPNVARVRLADYFIFHQHFKYMFHIFIFIMLVKIVGSCPCSEMRFSGYSGFTISCTTTFVKCAHLNKLIKLLITTITVDMLKEL